MQGASTATLWSGRDQWCSECRPVFQQLCEVAVRVSSSKGTGHGIFHSSAEADPAGLKQNQQHRDAQSKARVATRGALDRTMPM